MFELSNYLQEIKAVADANNVDYAKGAYMFRTNLIIMREHYKGASSLNYHELGQQWNSLLSSQKVQQYENVLQSLKGVRAKSTRRNTEM